jgi:hypothetical protein
VTVPSRKRGEFTRTLRDLELARRQASRGAMVGSSSDVSEGQRAAGVTASRPAADVAVDPGAEWSLDLTHES